MLRRHLPARAFTFLELGVAFAVVAVVAATATTTYRHSVDRSHDNATAASVTNAARGVVTERAYTEELGPVEVAGLVWVQDQPSGSPDVMSWSRSGQTLALALRSPTGRCARIVAHAGRVGSAQLDDVDPCVAVVDGFEPVEVGGETTAPPPTDPMGLWDGGPAASAADAELTGWVNITGGAISVAGDLVASGTVNITGANVAGTVTCSGGSVCGSGPGSAQQLGTLGSETAVVHVPTALSTWYAYRNDVQWGAHNYRPGGTPGEWYDLCPDATIRLPNGHGPCEGEVVTTAAATNDWVGFEGWRHDTQQNRWVNHHGEGMGNLPYGPTPAWMNPARQRARAVFYVHHADAVLQGTNGGVITVIASTWDGAGGNIDVQGGGVSWWPKLGEHLFVADSDLRLRSSAPYHGWSGAGGRLNAGGQTDYTGRLVAEGRTTGMLGHGPALSLNSSVTLRAP